MIEPEPPSPPPPIQENEGRRFRALRIALLAAIGIGVLFVADVLLGLPPRSAVRELARRSLPMTAMMREREAETKKAGRPWRRSETPVPLSRIARPLLVAVVTAEDPNFFAHRGIDWGELKESVRADVRLGTFFRGGSTITQQLAKNLFLSSRKSLVRKAREMIIARWLEADLGKARILELYLNVIEFGDGVYGCEAASRLYYGKAAADLTASEAAGLAGIIPSPRRLNPLRNAQGFARVQKRVLWLMARRPDVARAVGALGAARPEEPIDAPPADDEPSPEPSPEV